tara:strand:- start:68 stop:778 length:711 start_codon:yes stop_codon:yes gene_type:complete
MKDLEVDIKYGSWNFGGKIPKSFEDHVKKSVPFYDNGHQIIKSLSNFFMYKNALSYDLGCSTSNLNIMLSKHLKGKKVKFIGIDEEKKMIILSKKKIKKNKIKNIELIHSDLTRIKFQKSNLIISYYTLQFLTPSERPKLLKKIYKSLHTRGAFILFEKIRGNDERFQDILNSLYYDFKESNGISPKNILNKTKAIRGVLEPYSDTANIKILTKCGFRNIQTIFQYLNFKGYLCIK